MPARAQGLGCLPLCSHLALPYSCPYLEVGAPDKSDQSPCHRRTARGRGKVPSQKTETDLWLTSRDSPRG